MSVIERSPKIPLSPSSPPETGLKRRRLSDSIILKSPLSPPLMSVATKSYVSSYQNQQHSDEMASRSSPRSPTSSSSYTQKTQRASQAYSTPASSTSGIPGLNMVEDSDQHRDKRQRRDSERKDDSRMDLEEPTSPTNHERQAEIHKVGEESITLRKAELIADQDSSSASNLEKLQEDVGDAFFLCTSKVPRQRLNPEKHLLHMYGLSSLLRSVARNDPLTGEKINKLRKSYEGQIKTFGLSGINKPTKGERNVEEDQPGPLRRIAGSTSMGLMPEDQWLEERAISKIEVTTDFRSKLQLAMQMQPGKVRDIDKWDTVLGHEKSRPGFAVQQQVAAPLAQRVLNGITPRPTMEARRQTRGKKRSYGDESFVGYGEGYSDPEDNASPDAELGEGDGGSRRKRRKESMNGQGSGQLSYGNPMGR